MKRNVAITIYMTNLNHRKSQIKRKPQSCGATTHKLNDVHTTKSKNTCSSNFGERITTIKLYKCGEVC